MAYEYKMIQIPRTITVKAKELQGNEAADYLQSLTNQLAAEGREFFRVDEIGVEVEPGCLASLLALLLGVKKTLIRYYVVTFRRPK